MPCWLTFLTKLIEIHPSKYKFLQSAARQRFYQYRCAPCKTRAFHRRRILVGRPMVVGESKKECGCIVSEPDVDCRKCPMRPSNIRSSISHYWKTSISIYILRLKLDYYWDEQHSVIHHMSGIRRLELFRHRSFTLNRGIIFIRFLI